MGNVARRSEVTSSHLQDTRAGSNHSTTLSIEDDIPTRKRSPFASRNNQHPPMKPLPTPDYSFYPQTFDGNTSSAFSNRPVELESVAKLAGDASRKTSMAVKHFDRPAGHSNVSSTGSFRQRPSDPSLNMNRTTSGNFDSLGFTPGLDRKVSGNNFGGYHQNLVDPAVVRATQSSVPRKIKGHQQAHSPRFVLRTLLPANPPVKEARLRPSIHHVPGSYQTDFDHNADSKPALPVQSAAGEVISANLVTRSVGPASEGIVDELKLPVEDKQDTMKLLVLPPLASGIDHGHDHGADKPLLPLFHGSDITDHSKQLEPLLEEQPMASVTKSPLVAEGPQLSDLLSQLPPLKLSAIDDFRGHHLTAKPELNSSDGLSTPKHSLQYRNEPSEARNKPDGSTRQSSHSPQAEFSNNVFGLSLSEPDTGQPPLPTKQPDQSRVPSIHSSAMSRLSPISSKFTLRTKSSTVSLRAGTDDLEEAAGLIERPSVPSSDHTTWKNYRVNSTRTTKSGKLFDQSYPGLGSDESGRIAHVHEPSTESQKHWVRQLLARRTDTPSSQDPPHLTARPYHRRRHATNQLSSREDANFSPLDEEELPVEKGSSVPESEDYSTQTRSSGRSDRQMTSESFTKVISDLEILLNEALSVAKHAAERENTESLPPILEEATRILKDDSALRIGASNVPDHTSSLQSRSATTVLQDVDEQRDSDSDVSSDSENSHLFGNEPRYPENPEEHLKIVESDEPGLHSGHFKRMRDITPYPSSPTTASRQVSIAPQGITSGIRNNQHPVSIVEEQLPEQLIIRHGTSHKSQSDTQREELDLEKGFGQASTNDLTARWFYDESNRAYPQEQRQSRNRVGTPKALLPIRPTSVKTPSKEETRHTIRETQAVPNVPSSVDVQNYIIQHCQPPIQPRISSAGLRSRAFPANEAASLMSATDPKSNHQTAVVDHEATPHHLGLNHAPAYQQSTQSLPRRRVGPAHQGTTTSMSPSQPPRRDSSLPRQTTARQESFSLRDRHHVSVRKPHGFSLSRSHRRSPIARDWGTSRKRFVAAVACISTALLGLIVGIYAGEVPAIQYSLADEHHYTILGNVFFYIALAIPTVLLWPLPLLHGRKPYTLIALALLLPLQFPQALVVGTPRSPYVATYRVGLLFSRAISGIVMGFANINFKTTLLDLFGASLQSGNPHQEIVNENDIRRHGGGMGVWLGIWTWCFIGSIGVGFLIGAVIISGLSVAWGFYITVILIASVLLLNVLTPEVRRSQYRRSVAEIRTDTDVSRRVARGEVMMHIKSTGPIWWWEEVMAGQVLCARMLKQPGFVVLSLYIGWIYGQIIMVIVVRKLSWQIMSPC